MIMGRVAVGILIFALVVCINLIIVKAWDPNGSADLFAWGYALIILITTYCTASGLWLLIHFGYL